MATAGDVNGDGYADVIVGAPNCDNGQTNEGRAFAYHGSATGLSTSPAWTAESGQAFAFFGVSVATAGDINGDGYTDVIVGALDYGNDETEEGRAFAYHGSSAGLAASPAWTAESDQASAFLGISVATAGDVNGDGYADVIVGADAYDSGQPDEGRAVVFCGNGGSGLNLNPRQRSTTDAAPIAHLGASDSPDSFRINLVGRSPFGRGRVRLEWEVKPLGVSFDAIGMQTANEWSDTGTGGVGLSELATSLLDSTPYHWRVRLRYEPVTTPFAPRSRWLTMPWKGWQETMLRTAAPLGAAHVAGLLIDKAAEPEITLSWDASCLATDTDYAIYEGVLGDFATHGSRYCGTGGPTTWTFTPLAGNRYYLVVPRNATREGSYGTDSNGVERSQGVDACLPQQIVVCP